ncbi:transposase [Roseicella sp. GB24]|uniref:Transposase n=1 Tax=Roseicella aerolata TaxID=2883479 RepID=A0A9X1I9P5_9PROT|nr:transposase [Roseicella aerolata]MCB4820836.1 transposase [Roseicella aerolata]
MPNGRQPPWRHDPSTKASGHPGAVQVFGTWKRSYGLRRMRWLGLAKAGLQVRLAAIAYNLRRTITMLQGAAA